MKPIAPASGLAFPLAAGLVSLPLWIESPLWGVAATFASAAWAYGAWRQEVDRRSPLPHLEGEAFEPLEVAIDWRTAAGEFPAARKGWRAVLTEGDLWLSPIQASRLLGGDRDHVRIPLLDVIGCDLATETEVRVRFLDEEHRAQEARLAQVPRAAALATALGYSETESRGSWIV